MNDETPPRPGSTVDLSRRMDNIERRQDNIETEVRTLASTVGRVEQNQVHAAELNKLRFDALDMGVKTLTADLTGFMARIDGIISGEIETAQSKRGAELVKDYMEWRDGVDARLASLYTPEQKARIEERLDSHDKFEAQGRLLARIGVLLVSSNVIAIIAGIAAILK